MEPDADLTAVLGAAPPASVAALPPEVQQRLAAQVAEAKRRLESDTEASVQKAIAGVPFAVRGIVKKALLG
ncbi:hypothetical protein ABIE44_002043 [Marmoricola sp. OAE513]|uniref:hypothetical protein n=1 Tax=Marmoricola sp. OAE513 TaxID=2817894 RepID=UPI001AE51F20